jgi:hypothetical protein
MESAFRTVAGTLTGAPRFAAGEVMMADVEERALEEALEQAPRGAFALAGAAVALLILAWLAIYFFIFLPRGQVG